MYDTSKIVNVYSYNGISYELFERTETFLFTFE